MREWTISLPVALLAGACAHSACPISRYDEAIDCRRIAPASQLFVGGGINAEQAASAEIALEQHALDVQTRISLLAYYGALPTDEARGGVRHLIWLVRDCPEVRVLGIPVYWINSVVGNNQGIKDIHSEWLKQVQTYPDNPTVLFNAGVFFEQSDLPAAQAAYQRSSELDLGNVDARWALARVYRRIAIQLCQEGPLRQEQYRLSLDQYAKALDLVPPQRRLRLLAEMAQAALDATQYETAKVRADELLAESKLRPRDDYHRSAVLRGHTVLGIVAIRTGDVSSASSHLLSSVRDATGNPPTCNVNVELADAVLESGERAVVTEYLELCKALASKDDALAIDKWIARIRAGEKPMWNDGRLAP